MKKLYFYQNKNHTFSLIKNVILKREYSMRGISQQNENNYLKICFQVQETII